MKQRTWITILATLFLITGCSNETNKAENKPTIKTDQASVKGVGNLNLAPPMTITSIPTINYLLPQKNSEERITPITHIVFISPVMPRKSPRTLTTRMTFVRPSSITGFPRII